MLLEQERVKVRAELQQEQDERFSEMERVNKETFQLVLDELHLIKNEHDEQIAKFDLLIDK